MIRLLLLSYYAMKELRVASLTIGDLDVSMALCPSSRVRVWRHRPR